MKCFFQLIKIVKIEDKYKDVKNKQLLRELIKMEIRSKTISYSKTRKFNMKNCGTTTQRKLEELDQKICNHTNLNDETNRI